MTPTTPTPRATPSSSPPTPAPATPPVPPRARPDRAARTRRSAQVAGVLYLVTFVTSIPTLRLYAPLREGGGFLDAGAATGATVGVLLEVVLALACVGTAVALYPVTRRHGEALALGFVASRLVEAGLILVGAVAMLSVVALDREPGGLDPAALRSTGHTLVTVYDGTFLLGQSLMPVVNAVLLGALLYRSGLVPRLIPAIGLVGAPLLLASDLAIVAGAYEQGTAPAALAALPIAAWELALGVRLVLRGFRPVPEPADPEALTDPGVEPAAR